MSEIEDKDFVGKHGIIPELVFTGNDGTEYVIEKSWTEGEYLISRVEGTFEGKFLFDNWKYTLLSEHKWNFPESAIENIKKQLIRLPYKTHSTKSQIVNIFLQEQLPESGTT